jgi:hypothetical protein
MLALVLGAFLAAHWLAAPSSVDTQIPPLIDSANPAIN